MSEDFWYREYFDAKFAAGDDGQLEARETWSADAYIASLRIPKTPT
jgi:hypothetical protein